MTDITAQKVNIRKEVDMRNKIAQKGFTLIELLIVIVIIGVLAGIVIVILNPAVQRRRAQDSVILATMNKIGAEVLAYANADITGTGTFPACAAIAGTGAAGSCTGGTLSNVYACTCGAGATFSINGVTTGPNTAPLSPGVFKYVPTGATQFCISANALNPTPSTSTFIKYNYPGDTGPAYAATGC